jgi:hypothetical protein
MEPQVFTFSLKIDDDKQTLSETNGLPIKQLGQLLIDLDKALELNGKDCTLSHISGNCYQLDYSTTNFAKHNDFVGLMQNVSKYEIDEIPQHQKAIKRTLNSILGLNYYALAYNYQKEEIAKITATSEDIYKAEYYTSEIISGVITLIGNKTIDRPANIVVQDLDGSSTYTIPVNNEQENALSQYYKYTSGVLVFEVRFKKDLVNNKSYPVSLTSFKVKSDKKINQSIKAFLDKHGAIYGNLSYAELVSDNLLNDQDDD